MSLSTSLPDGFPAITVEVKRHRFFRATAVTRAVGPTAGSPPGLSLSSIRRESSPVGEAPAANVIETNVLEAIQASTAVLLAAISALKDDRGNATNALPTGDAPHVSEKPKRKYKPRQTPVIEEAALKDRKWLTFKQAGALHPTSEQALRRLARQAEQYLKDPKAGLPSSGFERCIVRIKGSRRVYLDAMELDLWMASGRIADQQAAAFDRQLKTEQFKRGMQ